LTGRTPASRERFLLSVQTSSGLGGGPVAESLIMLDKDHRRHIRQNQTLYLHSGIDVYEIQRLVPYVQVRAIAQAGCDQHFLFLPSRELFHILFELTSFEVHLV